MHDNQYGDKAMTDKDFLFQFRRGIGSAIVELRQNENRQKYKAMVFRSCLKDIGYDTQIEGTKGHYLYSAITILGCEDELLMSLAEVYRKRLPHHLMEQLTDILLSYVWDGSSNAMSILREKYDQLKNRLMKQKTFPYRYCEREQFETLMIHFISIGKWKAFKQCVNDAGAIIQARKDDTFPYFDWFQDRAENQFTKIKVWKYFDEVRTQSEYVRLYVTAYQKVEETNKELPSTLRPVTREFLLEEIQKNPTNQRPYGIIGYSRRFARTASKEELVDLAKHIEAEDNVDVKTQLLRVFRAVDYPLNRTFLIDLAHSDHLELRKVAIDALERFRDNPIHDLAMEMLKSGDTESGLALLRMNWKKTDDPLIRKMVMKSSRVPHSVQMDLREIYLAHRSASCGDVLLHAYRNGECTYCRSRIVEAMGKNGVLPDHVLVECQYDSYDETRKYANSLIKRRGLKIGHIET